MKAVLLHQETSVTPLTLGINHRGFHHSLHYKYSKPFYFKSTFIAYKNFRVNWYGEWKNFCSVADSIIGKIRKDGTLSKRVLTDTKRVGKQLKLLNYEILKKDLRKLSNKQLAVFLQKQYKLASDLCDWGQVAVHPDLRHYKLSTLLKEILKDKMSRYHLKRKINEYFSVLIMPSIHGLVQSEKLAILKLANQVNGDKLLRNSWLRLSPPKLISYLKAKNLAAYKELDDIFTNYCWSSFGHLGPAKSLNDYVKDIKNELRSKNLRRELINSEEHLTKIAKLQAIYLRELHLVPQEKRLFLAACDFSENKVYRFDTLLQTWYALAKLLVEISKRTTFSVMDLRFMSTEEIVGLLASKLKISKQEVQARRRYCVVVIKGRGVEHLIGDEAKAYIRHKVEPEVMADDVKTLHGSVAFIGRVTGRVKIVNSPKDINKIKRGDILVSTQTNPDLLPAMRKAGAFVTDIGGITSHAAIVARELKKPCIIGTKIATQVFKDGDLVDVDAIKGNVTLIKKL